MGRCCQCRGDCGGDGGDALGGGVAVLGRKAWERSLRSVDAPMAPHSNRDAFLQKAAFDPYTHTHTRVKEVGVRAQLCSVLACHHHPFTLSLEFISCRKQCCCGGNQLAPRPEQVVVVE